MAGRHTVLIVDDSEEDRNVYLRLLRDEPILKDIQTVATGKEGIAAFKACPPDCVLLDYRLPGEDGLITLEELRAINSTTPIVMLTGQGSEEIAVASLKRGASDYVAKDAISNVSLRRTVVNAIEKMDLQRRIDSQQQEQDLFLRTLIHDARAPLRHISTFTKLLDEDIAAANYDEVLEHSEAIAQSTRRIQNLIDTLAAYALSEGDVEFEPVSMNEIVDAAISGLAQTIEDRGAQVSHAPLPTVTGHAPQLVQLLQNLIGNGIKYCDADTPEMTISAHQSEKGAWQFLVEDNGIGVAADRLAYIFEPFKRLWSQDTYEGTGLGLAICKKIVERHNGEIWCCSEKGVGSKFVFTLCDTPPSSES